MHANSILFLSHTEASRRYQPAGLGEIANAYKLKRLLENENYPVQKTVDIFELFGGTEGLYRDLAELNFSLADQGCDIVDEIGLARAQEIKKKILSSKADRLFILSLNWSLAALFSLGIQKKVAAAAKLYVHHDDQRVESALYHPAHLLLTETVMANERGARYGLPLWKMIHLPNYFHYEKSPEKRCRKALIERVKTKKKGAALSPNSLVIGCVSRLIVGKNVEYALRVVKKLKEEGVDLFFFLKGVPVKGNPYEEALHNMIEEMAHENWFFWDKEVSPFSEAVELYNGFDLDLHLSGAEAGSNTIVEMVSLGIPTLVLDASTVPSLFGGAAIFVKTKERIENTLLPYWLPDEKDLHAQLMNLICDEKKREEVRKRAKSIAKVRFAKERVIARIPLILEAMGAYFDGGARAERVKKEVEKVYEEDVKLYATS